MSHRKNVLEEVALKGKGKKKSQGKAFHRLVVLLSYNDICVLYIFREGRLYHLREAAKTETDSGGGFSCEVL